MKTLALSKNPETKFRKSGLNLIGSFSWGTHFCQFYSTKQDLLDILVPYFKAGLENNEFCMWVTSEPGSLSRQEADAAMRKAMPNFSTYINKGQIEIIPHTEWYLKGGIFNQGRVLNGWVAKLKMAQERGFDGLRLTGNTFWLERKGWRSFSEYEEAVNRVIGAYRIIAICTYSLEKCGASEIVDVVNNHQFALIKKSGRWALFENSERKKIENALWLNQERFRSNIELTGQIPWTTNAKGEVVEDSPAWRKYTGQSYEEIKGQGWSKALHPADIKHALAAWKKALATKTEYEVEYRIRRHDGIYRNFLVRGTPIFDEDGSIREWSGTCIDINERKQIELTVLETQEEMSRAQSVAHIGSWRLDVWRNELLWSDETYRIFAIPKGTPLTYEAFLAAVHPEDKAFVDNKWKAALRGEPYDIEHRILVDGAMKRVREKAELEFDRKGNLLGGFGIVQDITDNRRAEEKIRHLASFPQNNPNPIIELDENGKVIFSNLAAIKTLKRLKVAKQIKLFLPENFAQILKTLKSGKNKSFVAEVNIKDTFFIETVVFIPELKVARIYAQDITAQKNTESALEEARSLLESKVSQRTEELEQANQQLIKEILEKRETERKLRIRNAILKIMGKSSSRKEFLDILITSIKSLSGAHCAGIRVLNEDREIPYASYVGFRKKFMEKENWLSLHHDQCACIRVATGRVFPQDTSCLTKNGSLRYNNIKRFVNSLPAEEKAEFRGACIQDGFASVAIIPIRYKQDTLAVIHLADERKDAFPLNKIEFIEDLTPIIGEAIHKFDIEEKIKQHHIAQDLINELLRFSFEEANTEKILNHALEVIFLADWLGLEEKASIYLVEGKPDTLTLKAHKNLPEYLQKQCAQVSLGKCICGKAAQEGRIQFSDTQEQAHEIPSPEIGPHGHYCIPLVVPIMFGQKVLGIINLYLPKGFRRDQKKEEFLLSIANALAGIIQRKKAEEELRKSSERVVNILESLSDGFFALDKQWIFTYINSAAERIMQIKRQVLIGKKEWDMFPEFVDTKLYSEEHRSMIEKLPATFEMQFLSSNKWLEFHIYPSEEGLSVYFRDVTERRLGEERLKEAQNQLERAKRLSDIGTLAATVAHELRNPLAAVRMAAFNLKRKTQNPLLEKHFYNIEKKIVESDQIINNLLFYSRLKVPHYEKINMPDIIDECIVAARNRLPKVKVNLKKNYNVLRGKAIEADPLQMKELFANILNNSFDALRDSQGEIEVRAGLNGLGQFKVAIKDNGIGIDEEHLNRIHEPFFTTKAKGTGLGLTVCFQIVNLHNGGIDIMSKKEEGTTVTVMLPFKKP